MEGRVTLQPHYQVKLEGRTTLQPVQASFEEIDFRELKVGVKYKMKTMPHHYSYHTGIFKEYNGKVQVFEKVMYHGSFGNYKQSELYFVNKFYYKIVSQKEKIQQTMENRALHLILRHLLDPHFTWE